MARFFPELRARRMMESAALLVDEVLLEAQMRQWVASVPPDGSSWAPKDARRLCQTRITTSNGSPNHE
jgi:hypothetical protein